MNIGEQIAKYRKERHITQEQLGEKTGVTNRTVSKWESCITSPSVDLVPLIASALGVTLDQLFGIEKPNDNTQTSHAIKELISSSIEEYLPDILEDALSELMPKYLQSFNNNQEYSLLIFSRDKTTTCCFKGQGTVKGPFTYNKEKNKYCVVIPAQGGNVIVGGYDSKEEASAALASIFTAFSQKLSRLELA